MPAASISAPIRCSEARGSTVLERTLLTTTRSKFDGVLCVTRYWREITWRAAAGSDLDAFPAGMFPRLEIRCVSMEREPDPSENILVLLC